MADPVVSIKEVGKIQEVTFLRGTEVTPDLLEHTVVEALKADAGRFLDDLWDFSGCVAHESLRPDTMIHLVDFIRKRHAEGWNAHTALVVDSQVNLGLSRMFQILSEENPLQIQIFRDREQARAWLG